MHKRDIAVLIGTALLLAAIAMVGCTSSGNAGFSMETVIGQSTGGIQGTTRDLILFVSLRAGYNGEIFTLDSGGVRIVRLTASGGHDTTPTWSPDGTEILFAGTEGTKADLWRARVDNGLMTGPEGEPVYFYQVTEDLGYNLRPSWSTNDVIACNSDRDGRDLEIYTMNIDGSNQTRITNDPDHSDNHPAWSPTGTEMAFSSNRIGETPEIFVMDANGANARRLTTTQTGWASLSPAWSPDGNSIAYVLQDPEGDREIYTMDTNGGTHAQITSLVADGIGGNHHPAWSPDSQQIAFERFGREQVPDIWLMNADGTNKRQLTTDNERDAYPCWSPAIY